MIEMIANQVSNKNIGGAIIFLADKLIEGKLSVRTDICF